MREGGHKGTRVIGLCITPRRAFVLGISSSCSWISANLIGRKGGVGLTRLQDGTARAGKETRLLVDHISCFPLPMISTKGSARKASPTHPSLLLLTGTINTMGVPMRNSFRQGAQDPPVFEEEDAESPWPPPLPYIHSTASHCPCLSSSSHHCGHSKGWGLDTNHPTIDPALLTRESETPAASVPTVPAHNA